MAYRLKRQEPLVKGLERVAREEFEAAIAQVSQTNPRVRDRAIHEARKSVKKLRGLLRLLQPELGKLYDPSSEHLQSVGRKLSSLRDAGAMIGAIDGLQKTFHSRLGQQTLGSIRAGLMKRKKETEQQAKVDGLLAALGEELREAAKLVDRWNLNGAGFSVIEGGLEKTFRRGRKAYEAVQDHHRAELFHDWRKRVKDHWYHIRLLEPASKDEFGPYQTSLKDLETWLGDDHNMTVLRQRIHEEPAFYGTKEVIDLAIDIIGQHQTELRGKALEAGKTLYQDKPSKFVAHVRDVWQAWHQ